MGRGQSEVVLDGEAGEDAAEFLSSVLAAVPAFITRVDAGDIIRYINRVVPSVARDAVIGRNVFEFIDPADHSAARRCFEKVREELEPDSYHASASGLDGELALYDNFVSPVRDGDGSLGLCIVGMDVTQRAHREKALRMSEEKLRLAIDATGIGLWSWDLASNEVLWDERMREICDSDTPLDLNRYLEDLVHPEDRDIIAGLGARIFDDGRFEPSLHRIRLSDGRTRWLLATGKVLLDDQGKPARVIGGNIDFTEQRSVEEQLRQAQKMEAVGILTAGVAHNFNNMLMVILPALDLLKRVTPDSHLDLLEDAKQSGLRAAEMVRQLMTFSGQTQSRSRTVHRMATLLEEAVRICRRTFDRHIRIEVTADEGLFVDCDSGSIKQVLMSVLLNARDALLEAEVASPRIVVELAAASPSGVRGRGSLRLRISDNGPGMDEHTRYQIFEPFFTTKIARSTGLGLSASYAIVREHGGQIECTSEVGGGTTFEILLPLAPDASPAPVKSAKRILLVDDERAIRRIVETLLGDEGYEVVSAESGAAAIEVLESDSSFEVVMLDRSLPGAPGATFVPELRRRLPAAKIFYFTGEHVSPAEGHGVDGVLQKPLDYDALIDALEK